MTRSLLISELQRDEGTRLVVYDDATGALVKPGSTLKGHPTIGTGRALDAHGISPSEALMLLNNDIDSVLNSCEAAFPWWSKLDDVRQRVLCNMAFNLGFAGLLEFRTMLGYMGQGQYGLAADAMEASEWYGETGARAVRLVGMMRNGG